VRSTDVARALGVDPSTVYRWERAGIIRRDATTAGGQARYNLAKVRQQLAEHQGDRKAAAPEDQQ
jgi:predicted site-specific integrase-resolvase